MRVSGKLMHGHSSSNRHHTSADIGATSGDIGVSSCTEEGAYGTRGDGVVCCGAGVVMFEGPGIMPPKDQYAARAV